MAIKPAVRSLLALGAIASLLTWTLLICINYEWGVTKKVTDSTEFFMVVANNTIRGAGLSIPKVEPLEFQMTKDQ
jgi:hypothetical protein